MDLGLFFGRFHPLIIHLPIGIILVALLLEWWGKASKETLQRLWFYGMITAVLAAFIGWLLAGNGAYAPSTLRWHKWLGFATCGVAGGIWILYRYELQTNNWIPKALRVGVILLLTIGGHKGGTLTHGDGYLLKGAPKFIQKMAGYDAGSDYVDLTKIHVDSILAFEHLVRPILERKCVSCHNPNALNGGLDLTTSEVIMKGGDSGAVIESGDASDSELFKRVVLEQSNVKFMPPKGIPMNYNEMEIIKSWINDGADFEARATTAVRSESMINAVQTVYYIDLSPRPWYTKSDVPEADSLVIQSLVDKGYQVIPFSETDNYLKVVLPREGIYSALDLDDISKNVLVLEGKSSNFSSDAIAQIGRIENLLRLDLSSSSLDVSAMTELNNLPRLESINLFGTNAGDNVLDNLSSFPSLKRVYVWQSKVTAEGVRVFESKRSDVAVEIGL